MERPEQRNQKEDTGGRVFSVGFRPFFWVSFSWLLLGGFFCLVSWRFEFLGCLVGLWILSLCDLFTLAKTAQAALNLISNHRSSEVGFMGLLFWGFLKLLCLGVFIVFLQLTRGVSGAILAIGVGTMVVVPIFGGYWWMKTESTGT